MAESPKQISAKICLFGDGGVGKTSLIIRYVKNSFDDKYIKTLGTNIYKKVVTIKHPETGDLYEFTLMIWDVMGQKGIRELLQDAYFHGCVAAIGVCDITKKETLEDLDEWRKSIVKMCGEIPIVLLGNKADLMGQAVVTRQDVKDMMKRYIDEVGRENARKMLKRKKEPVMLTSAKTGEGVEQAFEAIAESLL